MQGLVKSGSYRGSVGKRRRPCPINRHASTKAAGFWVPRCSALDLWLCLEAMPERALGPGATVGILGTGVPRLACLRPAAWLKWGPHAAQLHQLKLKTLARGQASRSFLGGSLNRQARKEAETRRAPGGRWPAQCPCFPFRAKGASTVQGIRQRLPFWCNKTKTSRTAGWRSSWSPGRRHRQDLWQPKTTFGQDNLY